MAPTRLPPSLLRPAFRAVDGAYIAFQGIVKSLGMVSENTPPPVTGDGSMALLPRHAGKWPELRVRLPEKAVFWYYVESVFRRAGLWRVPAPAEEVEAAARRAAEEAWPEATERRRGTHVLELSFEAGGLQNLLRVTTASDAGPILSVAQRIGAVRFEEAERALREAGR